MPSPRAELALPLPHATDPELEALPEPRRPWRKLTISVLTVTALASLAMIWALRGEVLYSLRNGPPTQLGNLETVELRQDLANRWVQGTGQLDTKGAIRYSRPLESDTFRLAPLVGRPGLRVEIRVPAGLEGPHFVAPSSFVGRLVPISRAGLRHKSLGAEVKATAGEPVPSGAWLLVDGESPAELRWAVGLVGLFLAFFAFNAYGLYRIVRPVRDG